MLYPLEFLERYGQRFPAWSLVESRRYARSLTKAHYENFSVASWLVPRHLRQDYCNLYAYCRWADDLGDETGDAARSLELLGWWREQLAEMEAGRSYHPVFVALRDTARRHSLPRSDFEDLVAAFETDQTVRRYPTYSHLLDYCRYSANPVGRLVLRINGYRGESLFKLSDSVCTGLQLANHWQDVRRDWNIDRVYLPEDVMQSHGYSLDRLARDIERETASAAFKDTLRELVSRTQALFYSGLPLADRVSGRLALEVELFARAGMAVLEGIVSHGWDTIAHRPTVGKRERAAILVGSIARHLLRPGGARPETCNAHD